MRQSVVDRRRPLWFWLLLLLLLLLLWLLIAVSLRLWPFGRLYPPAEFYIQDQIILSGPAADIDALVATLPQLTEQERLSFAALGPVVSACPGLPSGAEDLVIDRYRIAGAQPDVAATIEAINNATGPDSRIVAEPNWVVGSPWDVAGSPWDVAGSPWDVAGSTSTDQAQSADPALYTSQWALRHINLLNSEDRPRGEGIIVGVFDTSPYGTASAPFSPPTVQTVDWVTAPAPMTITESRPEPLAVPAPSDPPGIDVANHGLFVAGMVHLVAPASDIRLIRVLENDNRGDLATLNMQLFNFMVETNEQQAPRVINLSLGVRVPPDAAGFPLPREVQSLRNMMAVARCLNIVVVAAAGNNSANLAQPERAELPADFVSVIGVAASNQANRRACFSNQGDIAAPGGDGRNSEDENGRCQPRLDECDGDCPFGVVGPVLQTDANTGYIYWTGSSFATPLVSGLAALVWEAGGRGLTSADVQAIIACGASHTGDPYLGDGVINVQRTLEQCLGRVPLLSAQQQAP